MSEQPLVTVLMPTYKGAAYLKQTVDSVLNQTFDDFELLIELLQSMQQEFLPMSLEERKMYYLRHRESFLREYYAKQLESEYLVLKAIAGEYKSFLTDSFSVEDWLQGLIQVRSENGFHSSWEVCARISICMRKCW